MGTSDERREQGEPGFDYPIELTASAAPGTTDYVQLLNRFAPHFELVETLGSIENEITTSLAGANWMVTK